MSVARALATESRRLQASSASPRLDVEILLAHVLGLRRERLYAASERLLTADQRQALHELVSRRAAHEPVAYLTGVKAFHEIEVGVTPDTLIPRPETETLVEVALEKLAGLAARPGRAAPLRVLDVCTGSGAVALAIAHARADVVAVGIDVQSRALEQARLNAEKLGLAARCRFLQSDLFAAVPLGSLFELVVANPPYVADHELAETPPDVHGFEPAVALLGGPDGLDFYRRIVPAATQFLAPGGSLAVEIAESRAAAVVDIFRAAGRYEPVEMRNDLGGRPRVVVGRERE